MYEEIPNEKLKAAVDQNARINGIPTPANNYISQAMQVPLWELLERVPRGMQLGMEMKNEDGTVYGHSHTPIGLHCHNAAKQLKDMHERLRELLSIASAVGNAGINPSVVLALADLESDPFGRNED